MILHVLANIVLPLFVLMGVGAVVQRAFSLDMATLSKLNFYVFVPGIVFAKLLDNHLGGELVWTVLAFNSVHFVALYALGRRVFGRGSFRPQRSLLTLSVLFNNCGNYGIPLAHLAFGTLGVEVMALTMVFQNFLTFTFGLWLLGDKRTGWLSRATAILRTPVFYAVLLPCVLRGLHIELPRLVRFPIEQIGYGMIPVALLTLGAQLARTEWFGKIPPLGAVLAIRLVLSPLLAAGLAWLWVLSAAGGGAARVLPVLVCGAGLPVGVNVYILALEYRRDPELASRMVFWSTLASAATMAVWLFLYAR